MFHINVRQVQDTQVSYCHFALMDRRCSGDGYGHCRPVYFANAYNTEEGRSHVFRRTEYIRLESVIIVLSLAAPHVQSINRDSTAVLSAGCI